VLIISTYHDFFRELVLLHRPFEHHLQHQLTKHGLFRAQWTVIYRLYQEGSLTIGELASSQFVEKPTMTKIVNRLFEMELVERVHSTDRREKRIQLTNHGKTVYMEVRETIDLLEQKIVEGISEEQQIEAIQVMSAVRSTLSKLGEEQK